MKNTMNEQMRTLLAGSHRAAVYCRLSRDDDLQGESASIANQCAIGLDMLSFWKSISLLSRGFIAPIVFGVWMTRAVRFHGLFDFALWVVLYTVIYALSFWLFGMDRDEKQLVLEPLAYLKHKDV